MILTRRLLNKFVALAGKKLTGDWIMVGGTVLPYLGIEHRSTTDIDFVGLGPLERGQQLELMKIAEELGLPVETINGAADFFVNKFLKAKSDLVLLHEGQNATIYRPSTVLFFRLKISRLSETDADDLAVWLQHIGATKPEAKELKKIVEKEITSASSGERKNRLRKILTLI